MPSDSLSGCANIAISLSGDCSFMVASVRHDSSRTIGETTGFSHVEYVDSLLARWAAPACARHVFGRPSSLLLNGVRPSRLGCGDLLGRTPSGPTPAAGAC